MKKIATVLILMMMVTACFADFVVDQISDKPAGAGMKKITLAYVNDGVELERISYVISSAQSSIDYFNNTTVPAEIARIKAKYGIN